jgi:hypothetical protein
LGKYLRQRRLAIVLSHGKKIDAEAKKYDPAKYAPARGHRK